ncbi:hypothetical protein MTP99_001912 [Tenebrio molitor]|nr:hypothetical protein MTP99_001912 [Tenebrio molitor]
METFKVRPGIAKLVKAVSEEHGIHNHIITDIKTNQKGEGYLGEIFMITVKDADSDNHLDMVIKAAFIDEKVREMVPIRMSFQNEIYFYSTVHPALKKFEKERGVSSTVKFVPKCLKVSLQEQEEMLALENLRVSGFEIFDKTKILDEDHVELIFKTYGHFHAYSFALRDQEPEEYEKLANGCYNLYAEFMKKSFFADHLVAINKLVESSFIPGEDDEVMKKYEKYRGRNIANIFQDVATENPKHSAILHGDCWSNNMMFKYEINHEGKRPIDMRLIDWQIIKVGSPVCDLSYCLYSGASKKVFDNLNHYLKIYYDSFSSFLRELGSDPDKLFPLSVLEEHWRKYSRWGMIMSFSILRMKLTHKEDIIDLADGISEEDLTSAFSKTKFYEEDYNKRVRGLVSHMFEVDAL